MKLNPQFLTDKDGNRTSVLLSMEQWQYILESLEDLEDIRAYDRAKAETDEYVPFEQAVRENAAEYNS